LARLNPIDFAGGGLDSANDALGAGPKAAALPAIPYAKFHTPLQQYWARDTASGMSRVANAHSGSAGVALLSRGRIIGAWVGLIFAWLGGLVWSDWIGDVMMKRFLLAFAVATIVGGMGNASAQNYPSRPITVVVAFAAGGSGDTIMRIVAEHMRTTLADLAGHNRVDRHRRQKIHAGK
jgi:hypothetical protein